MGYRVRLERTQHPEHVKHYGYVPRHSQWLGKREDDLEVGTRATMTTNQPWLTIFLNLLPDFLLPAPARHSMDMLATSTPLELGPPLLASAVPTVAETSCTVCGEPAFRRSFDVPNLQPEERGVRS